MTSVSWGSCCNSQDMFQYLVPTEGITFVLRRVFLYNQRSGLGSLSKEIFGVSISHRGRIAMCGSNSPLVLP